MNFAKYAKMAAAAFLIASILGSPTLAFAEGGESRSDGSFSWPWQVGIVDNTHSSTSATTDDVIVDGNIITAPASTETTDDVWVDGNIITAENYDSAAASSDPEWKYTPIRRIAD